MKSLRIGTWNVKNNYFNLQKNEIKSAAIIQLLETENLDLLALQEVNTHLATKLDEKLKEANNYRILTPYNKNKIKNLRVEYNMIIGRIYAHTTNEPIKLPYISKGFDLIKKLSTIRERNINFQCIITPVNKPSVLMGVTHLDYASEELGKRQMDEVINITNLEMQKNEGLDTIIAGNLNKKPTEKNMIEFTKQLSELGLQVVSNPYSTYIRHQDNQPVDYIIIPNSWNIESCETLNNYIDISSHRPVIVEATKSEQLILRKEM